MSTNSVVSIIQPTVAQMLKQVPVTDDRCANAEHRETQPTTHCQADLPTFKEVLHNMPDVGTDQDFDVRQHLNLFE